MAHTYCMPTNVVLWGETHTARVLSYKIAVWSFNVVLACIVLIYSFMKNFGQFGEFCNLNL